MSDVGGIPTEEGLAALRHAREGELLVRFLACHPLSATELAELSHVLPAAVLANPPRPRSSYDHPLEHYAAAIGYDVRNIKRMISDGAAKRPPDFPPLDNLAALPAWWARNKTQRVPDRILAAASAATPAAVPAPSTPPPLTSAVPAPAPGKPPATSAPPSLPFNFDAGTGGGGFEESVRSLRETLALNQERYNRAMRADPIDESFVSTCQRNVSQSMELLRKSEKSLFEMQEMRGTLVPITDVQQDWQTLLATVRMMRQRMVDNVCAALTSVLEPPALEAVRAAVTTERAREEQLLRSSKYWRVSPPISAPPDVPPVATPAA